jgi:hypothetical protein
MTQCSPLFFSTLALLARVEIERVAWLCVEDDMENVMTK